MNLPLSDVTVTYTIKFLACTDGWTGSVPCRKNSPNVSDNRHNHILVSHSSEGSLGYHRRSYTEAIAGGPEHYATERRRRVRPDNLPVLCTSFWVSLPVFCVVSSVTPTTTSYLDWHLLSWLLELALLNELIDVYLLVQWEWSCRAFFVYLGVIAAVSAMHCEVVVPLLFSSPHREWGCWM